MTTPWTSPLWVLLSRRMAVVAIGLLLGCGSDSPSGPTSESLAGTWTLRTVNGANLPVTIDESGNDRIELLNETIVVSAAGTFTQQGTIRITLAGFVSTDTYSDHGTFVLNGNAATFTFASDGSSGAASVGADVITAVFFGETFVYRR